MKLDELVAGKVSPKKGKTYEEFYGTERAKQIQQKLGLAQKLSYARGGRYSSLKKTWKENREFMLRWASMARKGKAPWNKGRLWNDEIKKKMSKTRKRLYQEGKIKPFSFWKGKKHPEEYSLKFSAITKGSRNPMFGKHHTLQTRQKISKASKGKAGTPGFTGKHHTLEARRKQSEFMKRIWQDKSERERKLRILLKATHRRPTKIEDRFIKLCEKFSLPFTYCGNGTLIIGGHCPDFYESNGRKICIEIAGRFWHTEEQMRERSKHFAEYGWKCIVIWEEELSDKNWHYKGLTGQFDEQKLLGKVV